MKTIIKEIKNEKIVPVTSEKEGKAKISVKEVSGNPAKNADHPASVASQKRFLIKEVSANPAQNEGYYDNYAPANFPESDFAAHENSSAPVNTDGSEQRLDDARRVKSLSPGALVAKRFFRNKLALTGLIILAALFIFCFVGSWLYPYREDQVFTTYRDLQFDYSFAKINSDFTNIRSEKDTSGTTFQLMINSHIKNTMQAGGLDQISITDSSTGKKYYIDKLTDDIYSVTFDNEDTIFSYETYASVGTYNFRSAAMGLTFSGIETELADLIKAAATEAENDFSLVSVNYNGNVYTLSGTNRSGSVMCAYGEPNVKIRRTDVSDEMAEAAIASDGAEFVYGGVTYRRAESEGKVEFFADVNYIAMVATTLVFDRYNLSDAISDQFRFNAIYALGTGETTFEADGRTYTITYGENTVISYEMDGEQINFAEPTIYAVKRYSGQDMISITTKKAMSAVMLEMMEAGLSEADRIIKMEALDEKGDYVYDEEGNILFDDEEFYIKSENKGTGQQFVFRNMQNKLVADIYASPSKEHVLGLDSNAMDVLARIMYGGRVSLLIGFIVVFLEIILGTIMGGISGYFGGFVDNLIMRIVDVFYCIPTMPILIILGAVFDQIRMPNLERVIWMMAVLGFLGWPGIARLVRGQILSLREQDFMIAAEASGLPSSRKIAKHLVPNVIPQLIVQATMGLGGVIITESTLSFLGLGVKFPMATWGQIINSVSTLQDMTKYTYIWIPVGSLICLAVIAFNFVGDGLRDAFDPKMNR